MELIISHTVVFSRNLKAFESGKRYILNQGGSRSSKTYSILQLLIFICLTKPKTSVSIVRKSFPSLRGSVLRDFKDIMIELNLYDIKHHNRTEHLYTFSNGSNIEFFSIDDSRRVRGRKRDICYCNESNELNLDDFTQLSLRTTNCLFLDFNPSENESFIYDLLKDERSVLIKSTYKDNIYLDPNIVQEIENLINVDENYYRIYALGEKPNSNTRIYNHFKLYSELSQIDDWCYGLDFGYVHHTAMTKIIYSGGKIYIDEVIYKKGLTISELIGMVRDLIQHKKPIYCDSARPEIIEELKRNGLDAKPSDKNVKAGIDTIKSSEIYINVNAENILKEYKTYSWKTQGDKILDEPVKLADDLLDSLRYAIHTHKKKKFNPEYVRIF